MINDDDVVVVLTATCSAVNFCTERRQNYYMQSKFGKIITKSVSPFYSTFSHQLLCMQIYSGRLFDKKAVLWQGELRNAAVNFDTYLMLQWYHAVSLREHGFLVCISDHSNGH